MSTNATVVTERGQISIPARIRRELGLRRGDRIVWERISDREIRLVVLEREKPAGALSVLGFARSFKSPHRTTEEAMRELREGEL